MKSKFWENVFIHINEPGKSQKWLANVSNVGKTVINSGIARKSSPSVDYAYAIAKALCVTVEELVDGDAGEQYLRGYIREKGWGFSPPGRIADIVEAVQGLSDEDLVPVRGVIKAMLDKKEASGIQPEEKSGKKTG
jgi:ribosome-binding protein aMBF1 (putative translation factor)